MMVKKHFTQNICRNTSVPQLPRPPVIPLQYLGYSLSHDQLADYARNNLCKNARRDPGVSALSLRATEYITMRFNPQLKPVIMRVGDGPSQPFLAVAANQGPFASGDTPERRELLQKLLGMTEAPQWWPCPSSIQEPPPALKKVPLQYLGYSLSHDQLADYARNNLCKNVRRDPGVSALSLRATEYITMRFNPQSKPVIMRVGDGPPQPFLAIAANQGQLASGNTDQRRDLLQSLLGMTEGPKWWPYRP
ncbi:hypothetical protein F5I97DRAFT_1402556 [Phlebopus sp. FC_14]|nr:hypothetical protein F5I97DRAFT_1402556 [Phlebopus sp. FC_14]